MKPVRLLCIANPRAYSRTLTDIPLSYARLAAHPKVVLFHADSHAMMHSRRWIETVPVRAGFSPDDFLRLDQQATIPMTPGSFDLALCRTLKPFPKGYLQSLMDWSEAVRFVNDPGGIQRQLHPDFLLNAVPPKRLAPTVVTRDCGVAEQFFENHQQVVGKLPNTCGARGVFRVFANNEGQIITEDSTAHRRAFGTFAVMFTNLIGDTKQPILWVRYLPRVVEGEKRLLVLDGHILGAYLRQSLGEHWIQNVSAGAHSRLDTITDEDRRCVADTFATYARAGLHMLGYDLLKGDSGNWVVSEINAGNIGGFFRVEDLGLTGVVNRFVGWLQAFAMKSVLPNNLRNQSEIGEPATV